MPGDRVNLARQAMIDLWLSLNPIRTQMWKREWPSLLILAGQWCKCQIGKAASVKCVAAPHVSTCLTHKRPLDRFRTRRSSEGINEGKSARHLCSLGPAAYDKLVAAFEANPYLDRKTRAALAAKTGGAQEQITNWYATCCLP